MEKKFCLAEQIYNAYWKPLYPWDCQEITIERACDLLGGQRTIDPIGGTWLYVVAQWEFPDGSLLQKMPDVTANSGERWFFIHAEDCNEDTRAQRQFIEKLKELDARAKVSQ